MALSIIDPCGDEIEDPQCDPCLTDIEHGRVRGVAYIHKSYKATLQSAIADLEAANAAVPLIPADVEDAEAALELAWNDGVAGKVIYVIPETSGTYDGGSPVEGAGYGDQDLRVTGYTHVLAYKDPNLIGNKKFYRTISKSKSFHIVWRTETLTWISENPVSIPAKANVEDDLNSEVVWNVEAKWKSKDPTDFHTDMIGFFTCPNP